MSTWEKIRGSNKGWLRGGVFTLHGATTNIVDGHRRMDSGECEAGVMDGDTMFIRSVV